MIDVCVLCESGPGSAEPKRGPGRPPVRLTSQPSLGGRSSKRKGGLGGAAVAAGTTPYGTNELVGRKIWCVLLFLCGIEARYSSSVSKQEDLFGVVLPLSSQMRICRVVG